MSAEGSVVGIYIGLDESGPIASQESVEAVAGHGLKGDRYYNEDGWDEPKKELTLVEIEAVEGANREYDLDIQPGDMRRQIVTRGVALNHLVGQEFHVGEVKCRGIKIANPCSHLQKLTGKKVLKTMMHRGGLRAQILESGTIKVGDSVTAES